MRFRIPNGPSTRRLILWMPLGFVLVSGAVLAAVLMLLRAEAIQSGERLTQVFARLTEDQTTRTMQAVDQTLQLVRTRLAGGGTGTRTGIENLTPAFRAYLVERPFLKAIYVLDVQGRVVVDTGNSLLGVDFSQHPYFRYHAEHSDDDFKIQLPVVSQVSGAVVIPSSRPWYGADGSFAGIVTAVIDPAYLDRIWAAEDGAPDSNITLLRRDGTLLMRSPFDPAMLGRSLANGVVFQMLAERPAGTLQAVGTVDGSRRVVSYRTLSLYPDLIIVVSQAFSHILEAWRRYALIASVGWIAGSAALAAMALWLRGEWRRRSEAERKLILSRDRMAAVMDHTVDGLVTIDQRGMVLSFSKPAELIFAYRADEVVGCNVNMLMPEPYHAAHDGYIEAYQRTGVAKIIGIGREVQGRRKDGTVFPMDLAVGELPIGVGGRRFVGTIRDISRHKAMEDQLRQAQKMEAVGQLTGGIAHDFNNLLAVMLGNVEIAREAVLDDKTAALLETAQRAGERGAELTRRLLAFSRRQTLLPRRVDVNRMVLDMVALLRRTLGETIRVQTKLDTQPLHALVDPGQLENALLNLAVNARDAMPQGGVLSIATGSVVLDEDYAGSHDEVAPGAYRTIAVSDNGTGMTAEVKARVFEPFFTTKEVGKGSGLGLSMVYGFVKQSGGHVSVYSEPGRGTTIRLYLPVSTGDQAAEGLVPTATASAFGQGQTILVVEDDGDVRTLLASMVTRLGFVPILAADGPQALETLGNGTAVDLMITDVVMAKGMSGLELATLARGQRPQMPAIFISGYSDDTEALADVMRSGGKLISKPFSRAQLAEAIQEAMRR